MSAEFRQIEVRQELARSDKLFRAAISAFCTLTRPSRQELAQLEDLGLQLYDSASDEARRYAAAALGECEHAPAALVRRLSDEPIEIAAPLLLKSLQLTEIDLIAIIGRHGASHANVVAQRQHLPVRVATLADRTSERQTPSAKEPGSAAETTRSALRRMMRPSILSDKPAQPTDEAFYPKLRTTALTGSLSFFQTALADALTIDLQQARGFVESQDRRPLHLCLKALGLNAEQAFMISAALTPTRYQHPAAIRTFIEIFEALPVDEAVNLVRNLQADAVYPTMAANSSAPRRAPSRAA